MIDPAETPIPEGMREDLMNEPEAGDIPENPELQPRQIVCQFCQSRRLQLIQFISTKKFLTLYTLCLSCGTLTSWNYTPEEDGFVVTEKKERGYLG